VAYCEGALYVADTYNSKIKRIGLEPPFGVQTIGGQTPIFDEPAGLSAADGILYVADTNHHAIRTIDLKNPTSVGTFGVEDLASPPVRGNPDRETSRDPASRAE
jgi:sugar lactone lactonase YvrE